MKACLLRIDFYLGGCRSLKEKRQRLKGIRERYGKTTSIAVCESGHQDTHTRSQWSFIASAADSGVVESTLMELERAVQLSVDAELIDVQREWLV
ncbi:MAG: DUF503 domain-containing protein [Pseudomonadales bacterium]|jgi:hypothetical protein|nr:DUF503 domain-containing protein [Pseudomonadales bacterium]|tara:strand:- start:68 stop:352 length:285 start_codon:yes stop_codon:yes gene_type:complete